MLVISFALLAMLVAFIFFGLIPGLGAFSVRAKWRLFRSRMLEASTLPFLDYSDLEKDKEGRSFRLFGNLQAIQDQSKIWVRAGNFSIAADLAGVPVYILPSEMQNEFLPDEQPQSVPWIQISSLPAGVQMFLAGALAIEDGQAVFRSRPNNPLLAVIYDGSQESLLNRAIWCGRQKNEYWNQFTLISLITGSVALLFLAYLLFGNPQMRLAGLVSLTLSSAPLSVLLPPGAVFLFLYRSFWKKARILRAERDLHRLPLRYFKNGSRESAFLPDGQDYRMVRGSAEQVRAAVGGASVPPVPLSIAPSGDDAFLFGAVSDGNPQIMKPRDPMAGLTLIRGVPEENAQRCSQRARFYTLLSGVFFSLDIVPNLVLVFAVLRMLVR